VVGSAIWAGGCIEPLTLQSERETHSKQSFTVAPAANGAAPTRRQLQERLMGFADRYLNRMSEAMDTVAEKHGTPECRVAAHATKYYPGLTVVTIASEGEPEVSLLDLMVVVTLERMVWEGEWAREAFGEHADVVTTAQRDVEADIWSIAASVMTPGQLDEMRELIESWREEHPGRRYVSSTRFDDFASLRARGRGTQFQFDLLAPVSDAARAVEETRLLGERTLFIASRMPMLVQWQAELLMHQLAAKPEMKRLLDDSRAISVAADRLSNVAARWPDDMAKQRTQMLEELERHTEVVGGLIESVRASLDDARGLAGEIRQITESAGPVVQDAQKLTLAVHEALVLSDRVTERIERLTADEGPDDRPFDIREYGEAASELTMALQELNRALGSTEEMLQSSLGDDLFRRIEALMDQRVRLAGEQARATVRQLFWIGAALILLATASVVVLRYVRRRWLPAAHTPTT